MKTIPSFTIDHIRLLRGIYVSRKDQIGNEVVTTFDIRMTKPNGEPVMNTAEIHTIEHLAATYLRNHKDFGNKTVYFGPMGCRTGFYFIVWGEPSIESIQDALCRSLERVIVATEVPAANAVQCGNYRDLSLFGAQEYAKLVLQAFREK